MEADGFRSYNGSKSSELSSSNEAESKDVDAVAMAESENTGCVQELELALGLGVMAGVGIGVVIGVDSEVGDDDVDAGVDAMDEETTSSSVVLSNSMPSPMGIYRKIIL